LQDLPKNGFRLAKVRFLVFFTPIALSLQDAYLESFQTPLRC